MPEAGDGVLANAAIRREKNLRAGLVDHLPCLGQPVLGLRVEPDTLDSHPCSQERQHRNPVQPALDRCHRRVKLQDDAGRQPLAADMVDRRRGIGVFSMHRNDICTGFGKLVDLVHQRGVGDH